MIFRIIIIFCLLAFKSHGQEFVETEVNIPSEKISVNGTLLDNDAEDNPLVIIIPGSGANDRDGNQGPAIIDNLKSLAQELAKHEIATYRYDKAALASMKIPGFKEDDMDFTDFITHAKSAVDYFKAQKKYSKIVFAGHSQGSLVGMIAAKNRADGFISIAGPGRTIDQLFTEQVVEQSPQFKDDLIKTFKIIGEGKIDENFNPLLVSIFRKSLQPFWGSWMKYDPQVELAKLTIPVLIINGTKDVQVPVEAANLLKKAAPDAKLVLIEHMNHAFKKVGEVDRMKNISTYTDKSIPIMDELVVVIKDFVLAQ